MTVSNRLKNQHLLWRAAFGPMAENTADLDSISQKELWQLLVKTSSKKPEYLDVASDAIKGVVMGVQDVVKMETLTKEQRVELRKQSREDLRSLNLRWLDEMINSAKHNCGKKWLFSGTGILPAATSISFFSN